jgi:hypothetical protein
MSDRVLANPMDDASGDPEGDTQDSGPGDAGPGDPTPEDELAETGPDDDESEGDPTSHDEHRPCPECGESLPADGRFCPYCETPIDEDGKAVDLSELEGFDPDGVRELLREEDGERRASGRIRALAGLAVAIPLAPLAVFLLNSVFPLSLWTAPVAFLCAWLVFGAYLSRARVPVEAFGRSLYLLAAGTALVPVATALGETGFASDPSSTAFRVVAVGSVLIAAVFSVLGRYVSAQGRRRVTGENRAFEELREE